MLRGVLLALLSLSAVSCKSHDESQAKSQPGVAAGKVIEVTGTVTLHHGTETRPLAKGDMVDADDVVETGADGSAVIEVQHNNVNWELGANKKGKMRDALAWTQPKKEKAAAAGEEDSAAAGRHAERSAADNSATANERAREDVQQEMEEKKEEKAVRADKKKAAPPPKPEPVMAPQAESAAAPAPIAAPTAPPPVAQPQAATTAAPPPPPPPPPKAIAKTRSMAPSATAAPKASIDSDLGLSRPDEGGGGSIGAPGGGGGGGSSPDAAHLVFGKKADLRSCVKSVKSLRIKIEVDAAGKATVIFVDKASAADQDCVKKVIDSIKFPAAKTTITTTLTA